jgi:hypothetical protein
MDIGDVSVPPPEVGAPVELRFDEEISTRIRNLQAAFDKFHGTMSYELQKLGSTVGFTLGRTHVLAPRPESPYCLPVRTLANLGGHRYEMYCQIWDSLNGNDYNLFRGACSNFLGEAPAGRLQEFPKHLSVKLHEKHRRIMAIVLPLTEVQPRQHRESLLPQATPAEYWTPTAQSLQVAALKERVKVQRAISRIDNLQAAQLVARSVPDAEKVSSESGEKIVEKEKSAAVLAYTQEHTIQVGMEASAKLMAKQAAAAAVTAAPLVAMLSASLAVAPPVSGVVAVGSGGRGRGRGRPVPVSVQASNTWWDGATTRVGLPGEVGLANFPGAVRRGEKQKPRGVARYPVYAGSGGSARGCGAPRRGTFNEAAGDAGLAAAAAIGGTENHGGVEVPISYRAWSDDLGSAMAPATSAVHVSDEGSSVSASGHGRVPIKSPFLSENPLLNS